MPGYGGCPLTAASAKARLKTSTRCSCARPASSSAAERYRQVGSGRPALIHAVRDAIAEALTPHQRAVLVAITLNDVPIDVLADRRSTTRGAIYKTLHDARRKLRERLVEDGLELDPAASSYEPAIDTKPPTIAP